MNNEESMDSTPSEDVTSSDAHTYAVEHATAAIFVKLSTLIGLFAYLERKKDHLTHRERLIGLNKGLETAILQLETMVKDDSSNEEINSLTTFFKKAHIDKTNVSWEVEDEVGSLNIEGLHKGKVAFSLTLNFGEKTKTKNKDHLRDLTKKQGKSEEEIEAEKKLKKGPEMFKYGSDAIHEGNRMEDGEQAPIFKPKPVWSPVNKYNMTMKAQQGPPKP